jgi:hypothetical protein
MRVEIIDRGILGIYGNVEEESLPLSSSAPVTSGVGGARAPSRAGWYAGARSGEAVAWQAGHAVSTTARAADCQSGMGTRWGDCGRRRGRTERGRCRNGLSWLFQRSRARCIS